MQRAISIQVLTLWLTIVTLTSRDLWSAELDPAIWAKDIAAFEAMDRTNPPPTNAVLFVGSSSIRFWTNIHSAFPELKLISRGFGGSRLPDVVYYADRIIFPYHPSKIVLYGGDNDIAKGRSPEQVFADFRTLVEKVHTILSRTEIYYLAIKPSPSRWHLSPQGAEANRLIQNYCRFRSSVEFIDVWTPLIKEGRPDSALFERDNLHINAKGYELWAAEIRKALKQ